MTDLPPIGCTPQEGPFAKAWGRSKRSRSTWDYPIPRMIERAKAHRWSGADFERLRLEIQGFTVWSARKAWHEAWVKDEAKSKNGPTVDRGRRVWFTDRLTTLYDNHAPLPATLVGR